MDQAQLSAFVAADRAPALRHVWPHFSELGSENEPTLIVRGEGVNVYDDTGKEYFDALSSLYCVNVGHGRREIAEAMAAQAVELEYFPIWGRLTPPVLALADRIAALTPPGLDRVFFTNGGSDSVDAAWKLARQRNKLRGKPDKTKLVARVGAYHGTTMGALSVTGLPSLREPFAPLVPGVVHGPKVDTFHAEEDPVTHALASAEALREIVLAEGPDTVAGIIVEPVQNSGGCLVAPPEYFKRVREICDEHDLLFISDETICAWGRLGTWFGCEALGYVPDIITTAKALTSAYAPMGALIVADHVAEPFLAPGVSFAHGLTFGGHPVSAAAALANIDIIERERLCQAAGELGVVFRAALEELLDLPLVGDVRGIGLFQAIELVGPGGGPLSPDATASLSAEVPDAVFESGIICRCLHRGAPVLQFAPPLVATADQLRSAAATIGEVLAQSSVTSS